MAVALEETLQSGIKGFMLLSLVLTSLSHLIAAFSPGTGWKVNPFKRFYHAGLLADKG